MTTPILREITAPRPVVIGVNWYSNFDTPRDENGTPWYPGRTPVGHWWIGRGSLGSIRGGHAVGLKPKNTETGPKRKSGSWAFYDQGSEGACVGFAWSQVMSAMNQKFYFSRWLWDRAKEIDYWDDTNPGDDEGTSVKHAADILRTKGHVRWSYTYDYMNTDGEGGDWVARAKLTPAYSEGIAANRWITSMDDLLDVLGYTGRDYVDMWNSWGKDYPNLVRIPVSTMERLWREDGEICVPTDR
jgi:hypothetical protein